MLTTLLREVTSTIRLTWRAVLYGTRLDAKSAVTVACTFLGDLLQPIGDFTAWFFVGFALILVGCAVALRRWARSVEQSGNIATLEREGPPRGPRFLTAISFPGILLTGLLLVLQNHSHATQTGAIANIVPAIAGLQEQVGISNQKLDGISATLESIQADVARVKPETSTDPRKELANMGIPWTTQAFVDALKMSDARAVRLFLAGGMKAETNHNGASAVLFIFQPTLPDPVPMLKLLVESGYDPNITLIDTYIMPDYSDWLPPHFEAPGLPEEYGAWKNTFAGPALLWIVIRATYAGANDNDRAAIAFLREHHASTELSRACLVAMNTAWGETPAGEEVSELIGD